VELSNYSRICPDVDIYVFLLHLMRVIIAHDRAERLAQGGSRGAHGQDQGCRRRSRGRVNASFQDFLNVLLTTAL
jgi:hypothetical protein